MMVVAGLVPAIPLRVAPTCHTIEIAGTRPAMTVRVESGEGWKTARNGRDDRRSMRQANDGVMRACPTLIAVPLP